MKKLIILSLLFMAAFPSFTEATEVSNVNSIKITETTPVFDEYQKIAVFMKGNSHTMINESDRFYYTVMGNDEV